MLRIQSNQIFTLGRLISIVIFVFCFNSILHAQNRASVKVEIDDKIVEYQTSDKKLDGSFVVYKKLKSGLVFKYVEGQMKSNLRSGFWKIYDSINPNKIILQRSYSSPYRFEFENSQSSQNSLVELVRENINPIKYSNVFGTIEYDYIAEADIIYTKRLWRRIEKISNENLFSFDLIPFLKENWLDKQLIAYAVDNFAIPLAKNPFENPSDSVVAFTIKEDYLFDKNRLVSEYRIIGIAPIVIDASSGQEKELCWLYFPQMRSLLSKGTSSEKNSLENLFYNRSFHGEVYKYAAFRDVVKNDSNKVLFDNIDVQLLLKEHEYWLFFSGLSNSAKFY